MNKWSSTTAMTDLELVERCRKGEADAYGTLYDRYLPKIYAYLYHRTHHRETAEDLTSDVFLRALAKLGGFNASAGTFGAWLYRIAHNRLVDHYRAFRSTTDIEDVWDALRADVDIPRDADAKAALAQVEAAVRALPAAQREVVLLRVWDGLSHAEIAAMLGKNESAVKTAYSRGVASLKAVLGPSALLFILLAKQL